MVNGKGLSQAALGRALNLSGPAITKLKQQGMPVHSVEAAQAWRQARQNIAQRKRSPVTVSQPAAAPSRLSADGVTFDEWRTRRERAAALQSELDLAEQAGRLVDVDELRQVLARHYAAARDIALSLGARLAPILAAETDQLTVHQLLDAEAYRLLTEISGADDDLAARQKDGDAEA
jgi:hypothetical protein